MKYMGSKRRHAKHLLPIILTGRKPNQWYVEPFCGGCNMLDQVTNPRMAVDVHPHLMAMFTAVEWVPPDLVTETEYAELAEARRIDALTGYVGFALSFGGKFFGGYRRDVAGTKGCLDNMRTQSRRAKAAYVKQRHLLEGTVFICGKYDEVIYPDNSIIYCDPPYAGTTRYSTGGFDTDAFWEWCGGKVEQGHRVFVSEYTAPSDWQCVWEKPVATTLSASAAKPATEKLFTR